MQVMLAQDVFHVANSPHNNQAASHLRLLGVDQNAVRCANALHLQANDVLQMYKDYDLLIIPAIEGQYLKTNPAQYLKITTHLKHWIGYKKML